MLTSGLNLLRWYIGLSWTLATPSVITAALTLKTSVSIKFVLIISWKKNFDSNFNTAKNYNDLHFFRTTFWECKNRVLLPFKVFQKYFLFVCKGRSNNFELSLYLSSMFLSVCLFVLQIFCAGMFALIFIICLRLRLLLHTK